MINTGYPTDVEQDQFPQTKTTPVWYGFGLKNFRVDHTPVQHLVLADGQQHSEIDVTNPDEPLDFTVAEALRPYPGERPHLPVAHALTLIPTVRPGARPDMEFGQFQQPDTRPGVLMHARNAGRK